tara:strand:+ start:399 stop:560 length:162 start_codon:yes stop_codon:yes gene_type:complete
MINIIRFISKKDNDKTDNDKNIKTIPLKIKKGDKQNIHKNDIFIDEICKQFFL